MVVSIGRGKSTYSKSAEQVLPLPHKDRKSTIADRLTVIPIGTQRQHTLRCKKIRFIIS